MGQQDAFIIRIENQHWISEDCKGRDLCSHGEVYLSVNGTVITQSGMGEDWSVSQTALALLRTMDTDHAPDIMDGLFYHGCSAILMINCPITIDWSVKHMGNQVVLSDFVKVATTDRKTGSVYYPWLNVQLSRDEYARKIRSFAMEAKAFFDSTEKKIDDEYDRQMYAEFRDEYDRLLSGIDSGIK